MRRSDGNGKPIVDELGRVTPGMVNALVARVLDRPQHAGIVERRTPPRLLGRWGHGKNQRTGPRTR